MTGQSDLAIWTTVCFSSTVVTCSRFLPCQSSCESYGASLPVSMTFKLMFGNRSVMAFAIALGELVMAFIHDPFAMVWFM